MPQGKILMLVPAESASGGIKNYFQVLEGSFSLKVEYILRGAREWPYRKNMISELVRGWKDAREFRKKIKTGEFSLIQTSTSLGHYAILRDALFIYLAKKQGLKTVVFFRGWDLKYEAQIEKYYLGLFKRMFFKTDTAIVLANQFREKLISWGYPNKIHVESTIVDEKSFTGISEEYLNNKYRNLSGNINLLYLARVEKKKGIYETIDTFRIIAGDYPGMTLTIAGDGKELENVKQYVASKQIEGVGFIGHVAGQRKTETYMSAHLYIFPSYTEGMPNSVVEAMAFGLPVISSPVGGISDLIKDGQNGYLTASKDPEQIGLLVRRILNDNKLMTEMAIKNHFTARENFTISATVKRLEKIYNELI